MIRYHLVLTYRHGKYNSEVSRRKHRWLWLAKLNQFLSEPAYVLAPRMHLTIEKVTL